MNRAPHVVRSLFLLGLLVLPLARLVSLGGGADGSLPLAITALMLDLPLGALFVRELLRVVSLPDERTDVAVLVPGPRDGITLAIAIVRLVVAAPIASLAFRLCDGSWTELLGTDPSDSIVTLAVQWVLGAGVMVVALAIAMAERRTTYLASRRLFLVEGPLDRSPVSPLALFFMPATIFAAVRALQPHLVDARRARAVAVERKVHYPRRGRPSEWFTPVVTLDGGRLRAGDETMSRAEAFAQAQRAADRIGLPFFRELIAA